MKDLKASSTYNQQRDHMRVEIISILDRSGSMAHLRHDTISGYNGFLSEQRTVPGQARASLILFDDKVDALYEGVNVQHLGNLTTVHYETVGTTAVWDAIGTTLTRQGRRIAQEGWADKVIVSIVTDDDDNASREFSEEQARALIKQFKEEKGWIVRYDACGKKAALGGASLGIDPAHLRTYAGNAKGVAETYATMSAFATSIRTEA
jgi:hypothetical protein